MKAWVLALIFALFLKAFNASAFCPTSSFVLTSDTTKTLNNKRLLLTLGGGAAAYAGSLTGLYYMWYKDYPQSSFHFFNDNKEWLQMDKFAHATSSYYIGHLGHQLFSWSGLEKNKALWLGGFSGSIYLSVVEILDGFSAEWGFSYGDFLANLGGSLLYSAQEAMWDKQIFSLKYSYSPSPYAQYRPNLLGATPIQKAVKDYNGMTYWGNLNTKILFKEIGNYPDWLCISFGYSGDGMLGGFANPTTNEGVPLPYFDRTRNYYLSLDIDFTRLPIKSKYLRALCSGISIFKLPFPAIGYNQKKGFQFHSLYY